MPTGDTTECNRIRKNEQIDRWTDDDTEERIDIQEMEVEPDHPAVSIPVIEWSHYIAGGGAGGGETGVGKTVEDLPV